MKGYMIQIGRVIGATSGYIENTADGNSVGKRVFGDKNKTLPFVIPIRQKPKISLDLYADTA